MKECDDQKLSELVVKAKGINRFLNQFAKDCGVNPSTMSRLINMKNNTTCSEDLIVANAGIFGDVPRGIKEFTTDLPQMKSKNCVYLYYIYIVVKKVPLL